MSQENTVYYRGSYHYRRTSVLIVAMGLLLICSPLFLLFAREMFRPHTLSEWAAGLFPLSIISAFLFMGGLMARYYFKNHILELIIDYHGIRYASRFYPWQDINRLVYYLAPEGYQLRLNRHGFVSLNRHLMTDDGLTEMRLNALINQLQEEVEPRFDHLTFD